MLSAAYGTYSDLSVVNTVWRFWQRLSGGLVESLLTCLDTLSRMPTAYTHAAACGQGCYSNLSGSLLQGTPPLPSSETI